MSLWYQKNVYVSCAEEFWNCRKYGNTGTELYRWRSDWWYYCFCEDYRYIYADNKSNSRTLLDTMSKGVKEKRATKKALSINHKQYLYLSSGTYSIISLIRQLSIWHSLFRIMVFTTIFCRSRWSCPLKLDHIEFGDYSYQEITSKEKLLEVLSYLLRIGDFKQYAGKTILNNVYMDLRGKKPVFKKTKTAMERNNIFATIRRYAKKLKPQYNGDVYLEKCWYTYQGNETYAFLMSDKYIMV